MIVSPAGFCRVAAGCLNYFLILHPASFGSFLFPGFCWCYPCGPQGLFSFCRVGGSNPRGTRRSPWESPDAPAVDNIPLSAQMPVNDHDGASLPRPGLTRVPSLVCPAFLLTGLGNPTTRGKRARATEISALPAHQTYWAARQISKPTPGQGCRWRNVIGESRRNRMLRRAWFGLPDGVNNGLRLPG